MKKRAVRVIVSSRAERKVITYLNDKIVRAFTRESVAGGDSPLQSLKRIVRKTDITDRNNVFGRGSIRSLLHNGV